MLIYKEVLSMDIGAEHYGSFYWCIKTNLLKDGDIYVYADNASILPDGTLALSRVGDNGTEINLSISAGNWQAIYAAHVHDGSPFAIKHWPGKIQGA
jgi:hypothetical protein